MVMMLRIPALSSSVVSVAHALYEKMMREHIDWSTCRFYKSQEVVPVQDLVFTR